MLIQRCSKDGKRGVVAGSNRLTPEKIAAGALTAGAAAAISAAGGLLGRKKSSRAGAKRKKRKPLWLLALPAVYGAAKSLYRQKTLNGIVEEAAEKASSPDIEIINAEPISSPEEVYEHI